MKLRFFESESKSFVLNVDTQEVAGLPCPGVFADVRMEPNCYEELWGDYDKEPLGVYLGIRQLSMEDFTEVDSYGKPLEAA